MLYAARAHTHTHVCVARFCLCWYTFVSIAWALHPWKHTRAAQHAFVNSLKTVRFMYNTFQCRVQNMFCEDFVFQIEQEKFTRTCFLVP